MDRWGLPVLIRLCTRAGEPGEEEEEEEPETRQGEARRKEFSLLFTALSN